MNKTSLQFQVFVLIILLLIPVLYPGCRIIHKPASVKPVPFYRFPDKPDVPNLHLQSILTNPYGNNYYQGALLPSKQSTKHSFLKPAQIAVGTDSTIYILDKGRGVIIKMAYNQQDGSLVNTVILPNNKRIFPSAIDMIVTPDNKIWLTDSKIKAVFIMTTEGNIIDSIYQMFSRPIGIAYHQAEERILISDIADNSISAFDISGNFIDKYDTSKGLKLETPSFMTVDSKGYIYVNETLKGNIKIFSPDWELKKIIGGLGDGPGYFSCPKGIAVDKDDRIYVVDALFDNIQIFDRDGFLLLTVGTTGTKVAKFWQPTGITIDNQQRIFIADSYNRRIQVFVWEKEEIDVFR
ncbi:MAG: hypothetical protein ACE5D6_03640 [Candidatus Zixiibacteriota bacterium]